MVNAVSTFMSYVLEKNLSRHSELFGTGMIEGVAGPETANNSHAQASFIPLLSLGIPASGATAILLTAFLIHGITPGPFLFKEHPDVAWGLIASMYVGNVMLLILSLPLVRVWILALRVPYGILFPLVLGVATVGTFSVRNSTFDLMILVLFTALGYCLKKLDFPLAPAVLGFVLGHRIEMALRQSLVISQGDLTVFFTRPISLSILLLGAAIPLVVAGVRWRQGRTVQALD
jgi:putative tricarboxylic transport membrane protein